MFAVTSDFWNGITAWRMTKKMHRIDFSVTCQGSSQEVLWPVPQNHAADIGELLAKVMPEKEKS